MNADLLSPRETARHCALFIDFDGTLIEIAPRPDAVQVPPDLVATLKALHERLQGAVAIVSGRAIDVLDALLAPLQMPGAGEHGLALRRHMAGAVMRASAAQVPLVWREAASALAQAAPGTLLEHKPAGFVLHYRANPQVGASLGAELASLVATDRRFEVLPAHCAFEVRPRGLTKGDAVAQLMREPPFQGRRPIFIGDDVTDAHGIAAAQALGGHGLWLAESFGTPAGLRAWLDRVAGGDDAAAA
jgi:trehalose 6-phosphate phosphatase